MRKIRYKSHFIKAINHDVHTFKTHCGRIFTFTAWLTRLKGELEPCKVCKKFSSKIKIDIELLKEMIRL